MTKPLEIVTEVPTENQIRNAIWDYLIYDGWLVLRVNSGAAVTVENGKRRYVSFVKWMALGQGTQTAGVSDLLCIKTGRPPPWPLSASAPVTRPLRPRKGSWPNGSDTAVSVLWPNRLTMSNRHLTNDP